MALINYSTFSSLYNAIKIWNFLNFMLYTGSQDSEIGKLSIMRGTKRLTLKQSQRRTESNSLLVQQLEPGQCWCAIFAELKCIQKNIIHRSKYASESLFPPLTEQRTQCNMQYYYFLTCLDICIRTIIFI